MKYFICFLLAVFNLASLEAQQKRSIGELLSHKQIESQFPDSIKKEFRINYPIFRVYKYTDKSGDFLCVLTESRDSVVNKKDIFNHAIKALSLKIEKDNLVKTWEFSDSVIKNKKQENSIWFWTGYFDFKDFDNDGLIEPIIVYGTSAMNGFDDGRIKFIIFYKGQKIVIRHQNGLLDNERQTKIDKAFYSLPEKLKDNIKSKMTSMQKQHQAVFKVTL